MKYQIVGCEHMAGKAKDTGRPYDLDVLHVISLNPPRFEMVGNQVDRLRISRTTGLLQRQPQPGEIYDIYFDNRGYVEYVQICE